jgi:hypothetical protein
LKTCDVQDSKAAVIPISHQGSWILAHINVIAATTAPVATAKLRPLLNYILPALAPWCPSTSNIYSLMLWLMQLVVFARAHSLLVRDTNAEIRNPNPKKDSQAGISSLWALMQPDLPTVHVLTEPGKTHPPNGN